MTQKNETFQVEICLDCFEQLQGISEESDGSVERRLLEMAREIDLGARHICDTLTDENEFSWSQCETCASHLGGSRYTLDIVIF